MIEQHLALAEEHVALGERHIRAQITRIAALERLGADRTEARNLLARFEASQSLHVAHRDRLRGRISDIAPRRLSHEPKTLR